MFNKITNFKQLSLSFSKLSLLQSTNNLKNGTRIKLSSNISGRNLSTSPPKSALSDFFDDEKNWGATEVRSGRSWKKEELRLKSNTDLHKLWFVLLKERNMLLTMEQEAKDQFKTFSSPERLDKVAESMENLETVVRERNVAYHQLETGETGERPGYVKTGPFGLKYFYKMKQHVIPEYMNTKHRQEHENYVPNRDTEAFLLKYREKLYLTKRKAQRRNFNHVVGLLKRFPNMDLQALKEQYPDVDLEKAKSSRKCRGHFVPI